MADLAALQAQLDTLKRAYRSGVRTVEYDGRATTYVSGEEMRAAIFSLREEIAQIMGAATPTVGVVRSSKGY
ncbi:phage head-tail joining protein [Bradyrhizobium tunisiense]|uniref:phage head-tail joining protein n=1 Tax=Bradyrhizobium tunisiense TaxID=3278709 RepID=UPI0035DCD59E